MSFNALILEKELSANVVANVQGLAEERLPEGDMLIAVEDSPDH